MSIINRAKAILLDPRKTWGEIESEQTDVAAIYKGYLVPIALVPAIAGFVGSSVVGISFLGTTHRVPMASGLVNMVVGYALMLAALFVVALIVDALAPTFGGTQDRVRAVKVVAYGSTASILGGIFSVLPALAPLGLIASIYSIYLIYLGLPVLMRCPADKAVAYTALVVVCGVIAGLLLGAATAVFAPSAALAG